LPLQTAEKDIHVTDVLAALSNLKVSHGHFKGLKKGELSKIDDGIQLVFAGGTCLSKAHRLIARMSEDIDIKVILLPLIYEGEEVEYAEAFSSFEAVASELLAML
jgi:hypothetical protein